jgi:hypothetical protein
MPLSQNEAADALRDIDKTQRRSSNAYGYSFASPFFILWGVLWAIGYGSSDLWPAYGGDVWLGVDVFGILASFLIGQRGKKGGAGIGVMGLRYFATMLALLVFVLATFAVMWPVNSQAVGAFIPLLVALLYALLGIWTTGTRFLIAGIVVAALTLGGYFFVHTHFMLWMAAVGGGSLVLAGLWLRQA